MIYTQPAQLYKHQHKQKPPILTTNNNRSNNIISNNSNNSNNTHFYFPTQQPTNSFTQDKNSQLYNNHFSNYTHQPYHYNKQTKSTSPTAYYSHEFYSMYNITNPILPKIFFYEENRKRYQEELKKKFSEAYDNKVVQLEEGCISSSSTNSVENRESPKSVDSITKREEKEGEEEVPLEYHSFDSCDGDDYQFEENIDLKKRIKRTEGKITKKKKEGSRSNPHKIVLGREDIENSFCFKQSDAAKKLGVSLSTLKRRFYELGMGERWPFKPKTRRRRKKQVDEEK